MNYILLKQYYWRPFARMYTEHLNIYLENVNLTFPFCMERLKVANKAP